MVKESLKSSSVCSICIVPARLSSKVFFPAVTVPFPMPPNILVLSTVLPSAKTNRIKNSAPSYCPSFHGVPVIEAK